MLQLKMMGRKESQEKIASKAIHRVKHTKEDPCLIQRSKYVVEHRETVRKNHQGKVITDIHGKPLIDRSIHRKLVLDGSPDRFHPEGLLSHGKQSEPETVKQAAPEIDKEIDASLRAIMEMEIAAIGDYIENENPDLEKLQAMKAAEKKGQKRPQAYMLLNKYMKKAKGN